MLGLVKITIEILSPMTEWRRTDSYFWLKLPIKSFMEEEILPDLFKRKEALGIKQENEYWK